MKTITKLGPIVNQFKNKTVDPNLDKFDKDEYKLVYILITKVAFVISFALTILFLPEKIIWLTTMLLELFS